jgi:hypothetical protein
MPKELLLPRVLEKLNGLLRIKIPESILLLLKSKDKEMHNSMTMLLNKPLWIHTLPIKLHQMLFLLPLP